MTITPENLIWVRVGDAGEYHSFDTLDDALDYLNEMLVGHVTDWGDGDVLETCNYSGQNYVSLYWGSPAAYFDANLDVCDRVYIEKNLDEHCFVTTRDWHV